MTVNEKAASASGKPILELACNLANAAETDLRTPDALKNLEIPRQAASAWFSRPIWFYLTGLAWLMATLEWFPLSATLPRVRDRDMPLELTHPWCLLGFAALPIVIWYFVWSLSDFPTSQRVLSLVVRSTIVALLVFAAAGLTWLHTSPDRYVLVRR